ncbi:MAG: hydrogenase 3 maturation endopeptidase HyCI [Sedimentisphaerales bacterium]|nr:hydrogenase 3 maturation endopeptidase HyCI [Sedimentisphaerales bacterium]
MSDEKSVLEQLIIFRDSSAVILGIGNTLKGDDGAGPLVCQQLKDAKIRAEPIDAGTVAENYIQTIIRKAPRNLFIIDAIDFGDEPGAIKVFRPEQLSSHVISTHSLSPRLFIDMICQNIEVDVYFIGIQPAQMQLGQPVSPQVKLAIEHLTDVITKVFGSAE